MRKSKLIKYLIVLLAMLLIFSMVVIAGCTDDGGDKYPNNAEEGGLEDSSNSDGATGSQDKLQNIVFVVNGLDYFTLQLSDSALMPEAPNVDEYKFEGWFYDQSYTKPFSLENIQNNQVGSTLRVYAKLTIQVFTVTFDTAGAQEIEPIKVDFGVKIILPKISKDGFHFDGWFLDKTYTKAFDANLDYTKDLTLYTKWSEHNYDTKFDENYHFSQCKDCNDIKDKQEHVFVNMVCSSCNMDYGTPGLEYKKVYDNYAVAGRGSVIGGNIVVPKKYLGAPVTEIGESAFENDNLLNSIILPESLIYIRNKAFANCDGLTEINLPEGLTYVNTQAFYQLENLSKVTFPSTLEFLGQNVFSNNTKLENFILPKSLGSIGEFCFLGNNSLTKLTIPNNITEIKNGAFFSCENLELINFESRDESTPLFIGDNAFHKTIIKSIDLQNVGEIGEGAFKTCYNLETALLSPRIREIGKDAFYGCYNLKSLGGLTNSTSDNNYALKKIGDSAFENCQSLKINLSGFNNLEYIGDSAFKASLESVILPQSIKFVGKHAFASRQFLNTFTSILPDTLTELSEGLFEDTMGVFNIPLSITIINSKAFYISGNAGYYHMDISYYGTKQQWSNINKAADWYNVKFGITIKCTDGELTINNQ